MKCQTRLSPFTEILSSSKTLCEPSTVNLSPLFDQTPANSHSGYLAGASSAHSASPPAPLPPRQPKRPPQTGAGQEQGAGGAGRTEESQRGGWRHQGLEQPLHECKHGKLVRLCYSEVLSRLEIKDSLNQNSHSLGVEVQPSCGEERMRTDRRTGCRRGKI